MAIYKLFPTADASIYSGYPTTNTGLDAILDVSKTDIYSGIVSQSIARSLVKFSQENLVYTINKYTSGLPFSASLKLYLGTAEAIPTDYTIEVVPVATSWDMGTGRWGELPINSTGVTWNSSKVGVLWPTSSFVTGTTGSFLSGAPGGGVWWTSSMSTQSFGPYDVKDVDVDVTDMVKAHISGTYDNNGFIIKNGSDKEFNNSYAYVLHYFSRDTNTIYPPCLELKWDDSNFSKTYQDLAVSNSQVNVTITKGSYSYKDGSVQNLRLNVRQKFPQRTFSTSSLYTVQNYLPSTSYWSLVDQKTGDIVVDFDSNFTKLSADASGNYFTVHMAGLEPARYYKVLVKSVIGSEEVIFDNNCIFKVE